METVAAAGRTAVEKKAEVKEAEIFLILPHRYVSATRYHLKFNADQRAYLERVTY